MPLIYRNDNSQVKHIQKFRDMIFIITTLSFQYLFQLQWSSENHVSYLSHWLNDDSEEHVPDSSSSVPLLRASHTHFLNIPRRLGYCYWWYPHINSCATFEMKWIDGNFVRYSLLVVNRTLLTFITLLVKRYQLVYVHIMSPNQKRTGNNTDGRGSK